MDDPCKSFPQLTTTLKEKNHILTRNELENDIQLTLPVNKAKFITEWMSENENILDESNTEISSNDNTSTVYSSSVADEDKGITTISNEFEQKFNLVRQENKINVTNNLEYLQNIFNSTNNTETVGNIEIENSKNVHIGNVTYITGPIHIVHNDNENTKNRTNKSLETTLPENESPEMNSDNAFIGSINRTISTNVLTFIERRTWLAQKPLEPHDYLQEPAEFIIISHTATEMATTQADNIYLIRHIQVIIKLIGSTNWNNLIKQLLKCFHIESNRWNDISYNFLIGCDGNVYEGRGWGVVGAHTLGYNSKSLGISFIGCFMLELPLTISLDICKKLIKRGIELGHISPQYKLLAHCQCRPTESPGKKLFDEIKSWPNFCNDI